MEIVFVILKWIHYLIKCTIYRKNVLKELKTSDISEEHQKWVMKFLGLSDN